MVPKWGPVAADECPWPSVNLVQQTCRCGTVSKMQKHLTSVTVNHKIHNLTITQKPWVRPVFRPTDVKIVP